MKDVLLNRNVAEELLHKLNRIEQTLDALAQKQTVRDFYSIEQLAALVGRDAFTVREWARLGRIRASKRLSGRGNKREWVVSRDEVARFHREGLLPRQKKSSTEGGAAG